MRALKLLIGGLAIAGCSQATRVEAGGEVAPATPVNRNYLPAGTTLNVRLNQSLGTTSSHEGDQFTATVVDPVIAQNGATAVPAGAMVYGHVTGLHNSTVPGDRSLIRLDFDHLNFNGRDYPFNASVASVDVQKANTSSSSSSTTRGAVTGAAAGAVLGAIISGGELSKIVTGGLLGAAAGTVISLGQGGSESVIPAGSVMSIRSTEGVNVR